MAPVTTAPTHAPSAHVGVNRPNPVSVGTIVWLASELMFFAGLFAMYFTIRATIPASQWNEGGGHLNVTFPLINTIVLVASSFTCQMGVWAAERFQPVRTGSIFQINKWGMNEWMTLTFLMGSFFVAGQVFEYAELVSHGLTISSSPYGLLGHRLPRTSRPRRFVRVPVPSWSFILCKEVWTPRSNHRHCRVVLLALCRCRVDRLVWRHLLPEVIRMSAGLH